MRALTLEKRPGLDIMKEMIIYLDLYVTMIAAHNILLMDFMSYWLYMVFELR